MRARLFFLTAITLAAFAANSLFCRLALRDASNDALSFAMLRLASGAALLAVGLFFKRAQVTRPKSPAFLGGPLTLFFYAVLFSMAYVKLSSGAGALVLFGSVQLTMMLYAILRGQAMALREKAGFGLAMGGFLYLVLPSTEVADPLAIGLMALAGLSWGAYTLLGQGAVDPIERTAQNFILTLPLVALLGLLHPFRLASAGRALAIFSGAVSSAMGYVLWYRVLRELKTSTAAVVQLCVPALAALGGVLFLGEQLSARLLLASALIFGGIGLKVFPAAGAKTV